MIENKQDIYLTIIIIMDIEDIISSKTNNIKNVDILKKFIKMIIEINPTTLKKFESAYIQCRRKFQISPKKAHIVSIYREMVKHGEIKFDEDLDKLMIKKLGRKSSGVQVITVLTSPFPTFTNKVGIPVQQKFSCGKDCYYCPNEKQIDITCNILYKLNVHNHFTWYKVKSENALDEIRVITYFNFITNPFSEQIPISESNNYDDNMLEFDIKIHNKFVNAIDDYLDSNNIKIIATKIEQPRSYISTEPAVRRANSNNFDAVKQFYDRAGSLSMCGHIIDKIEVLVLGGTWSHYPVEYQEEFVRDIYYAANTFYDNDLVKRDRLSLEEEIKFNESATSRIIGLTLETRPDAINKYEIKRFRKYGCTRVQLGVQHIDDDVLRNINRGCYTKDTEKAFFLLKQNGYKIDIHLMPDLYCSSYEKDIAMFDRLLGVKNISQYDEPIQNRTKILYAPLVVIFLSYFFEIGFVIAFILSILITILIFYYFKYYTLKYSIKEYQLSSPTLQADQWKIYPTEVTRWTKIYDLFQTGEYTPYAEEINEETGNKKIIDVILHAKSNIYPWIRLNRVIRDIPTTEIYGGNAVPSLRQNLEKILIARGTPCKCIRCREVKNQKIDINDIKLMIRKYNDNKAQEYFISYESIDEHIIYGFCRLRLNDTNESVFFNELINAALVRELHVYGVMVPHDTVKDGTQNKNATQHMGFGKKLLKVAENISKKNGFNKISIISGIGVRKYYEKTGYTLEGTYMSKLLKKKF